MKRTVIVLILTALSCWAGDTNITRQVTRHGEYSLESVYRGKSEIMRILRHDGTNAQANKVISRSCFVGGKLAMAEYDEDGDGVCEAMLLYNSKRELELFRRQPDGSVNPASSEEVERFKATTTATSQFGRQLLKTGTVNSNELSRFFQKKAELEAQTQSVNSKPESGPRK